MNGNYSSDDDSSSSSSDDDDSNNDDTNSTIQSLDKDKHIAYLLKLLTRLPKQYTPLDTSRMTALYFATVGLDLLNHTIPNTTRQDIIDYIYAMQIPASQLDKYPGHCGFIGSPFLGQIFTSTSSSSSLDGDTNNNNDNDDTAFSYMQGHLAMTYTALAILSTLHEGFEKVDRKSIINGLKCLQKDDGVFSATIHASECDMRFVYCACAISYMLNDWSGINVDKVYDYIISCITYEGGISLIPGAEAHGGSTYCATASLALMNRLQCLDTTQRCNLIHWCHQRQSDGYQGRTNKDSDSCYSFWIGGTLSILLELDDADIDSTLAFLLNQCQCKSGGFAKHPDAHPDILHSFYSLCFLSMTKHGTGMKRIAPAIAICYL